MVADHRLHLYLVMFAPVLVGAHGVTNDPADTTMFDHYLLGPMSRAGRMGSGTRSLSHPLERMVP